MDIFIRDNIKFHDILSKEARDNFDFLVDYLCSTFTFKKRLPNKKIKWFSFLDAHNYVSYYLYTKENRDLVNAIIKDRSEIFDKEVVNGFSYIYDLDREIILTLESKKYGESIGCLEHELVHLLQAINHNYPPKQYNELLSFFGELVTMEQLSVLFGNIDIFNAAIFNRLVNRVTYYVYGKEFLDEEIKKNLDLLPRLSQAYDYMLGFIYATQLFSCYQKDKDKVLNDFNLVLSGRKTVIDLLKDYHISLEDVSTIENFKKVIDNYCDFVKMEDDESQVHYVKK